MIQKDATFLMANLGSEVARLYKAIDLKSSQRVEESRTRALRIIDELLLNPQTQGRSGEIKILKDVIEDISTPMPKYLVKSKEFEVYFMPFALRTLQGI
jgi:hypothetical protein